MSWYIKRTTKARVYLIGNHPMKDFVAITGGENDLRWLPYTHFVEFYEEESGEKK